MSFYRKCIERITPYSPGKSIAEIQQKLGIKDVIKLASNENPLGVSPKVVEALNQNLNEIFRYPDGSCKELVNKLADKYGVPTDCVTVGNGSDELIRQISTTFLNPEDEVIYSNPTFSEYSWGARLMGAKEVVVPLKEERHDPEGILSAITTHTKLIYVCNPNNPTGTYISHQDIEYLLEHLPKRALLVCDEAYSEYVRANDFPNSIQWVLEGRNLVLLRTFSKIHSLAGLRLGYALASKNIIDLIKKSKEPFSVNVLAQVAGIAAIDDTNHVAKSIELNTKERERLTGKLKELCIEVTPSESNFLWVKLSKPAKIVFDEMLKGGVIIRSGDVWQKPYHIRVTIGTQEQNDRFLTLFQEIINDSHGRASK